MYVHCTASDVWPIKGVYDIVVCYLWSRNVWTAITLKFLLASCCYIVAFPGYISVIGILCAVLDVTLLC